MELFEGRKGTLDGVCYNMSYKKFVIFLAAFFALSLWLLPSMAKATEKSFVEATTVYEAQKGKTVNISVYIHGSEKIAGGSLNLLYDQTELTVQKVELGDQLSSYISSVNSDQDGKVSLEWAKATGQVQEGTLLTITARVLKVNETTALDLQDVQLFDEDSSAIAVDSVDGAVKPFKGSTKKNSSKVNANKAWTVRFNRAIDPVTVNKYTVRVKDSRGKEIDVNVKESGSKALVVSPKSNYARGTYTLEITEKIRMVNGNQLKTPIRYEFSVK